VILSSLHGLVNLFRYQPLLPNVAATDSLILLGLQTIWAHSELRTR